MEKDSVKLFDSSGCKSTLGMFIECDLGSKLTLKIVFFNKGIKKRLIRKRSS